MADPTTVASLAWHAAPAVDGVRQLEVDPRTGLSSGEAARRLERYGANRLAEAATGPAYASTTRASAR
jgi:P-type Ca2+ transporter type 2C